MADINNVTVLRPRSKDATDVEWQRQKRDQALEIDRVWSELVLSRERCRRQLRDIRKNIRRAWDKVSALGVTVAALPRRRM
jgi:hypothetical protein